MMVVHFFAVEPLRKQMLTSTASKGENEAKPADEVVLSETQNLDRTMECANPIRVWKVGATGRRNKAL